MVKKKTQRKEKQSKPASTPRRAAEPKKFDGYVLLAIVLLGMLALYHVWGEELNNLVTGQPVRGHVDPGAQAIGAMGGGAGAGMGEQIAKGQQQAIRQNQPAVQGGPGSKKAGDLCNNDQECGQGNVCRRRRAGASKKCESPARDNRYCENFGDCESGNCVGAGSSDSYCAAKGKVHETVLAANMKFGDGKNALGILYKINFVPKFTGNDPNLVLVMKTNGIVDKNNKDYKNGHYHTYIQGAKMVPGGQEEFWYRLNEQVAVENQDTTIRVAIPKTHLFDKNDNQLSIIAGKKPKKGGFNYDDFTIKELSIENAQILQKDELRPYPVNQPVQIKADKNVRGGGLISLTENFFSDKQNQPQEGGITATGGIDAAGLAAAAALTGRMGNAGAGVAAAMQAMQGQQGAGGKTEKQVCKATAECSQDPKKLVCRRGYNKGKWIKSKKTTCRKPVGNKGPCVSSDQCRSGLVCEKSICKKSTVQAAQVPAVEPVVAVQAVPQAAPQKLAKAQVGGKTEKQVCKATAECSQDPKKLVCRRGYNKGKWIKSKKTTCRTQVGNRGPCIMEKGNELCRDGLVCRRTYKGSKWGSKGYSCRSPISNQGPCERDDQCTSGACKQNKCVTVGAQAGPPIQAPPDPAQQAAQLAQSPPPRQEDATSGGVCAQHGAQQNIQGITHKCINTGKANTWLRLLSQTTNHACEKVGATVVAIQDDSMGEKGEGSFWHKCVDVAGALQWRRNTQYPCDSDGQCLLDNACSDNICKGKVGATCQHELFCVSGTCKNNVCVETQLQVAPAPEAQAVPAVPEVMPEDQKDAAVQLGQTDPKPIGNAFCRGQEGKYAKMGQTFYKCMDDGTANFKWKGLLNEPCRATSQCMPGTQCKEGMCKAKVNVVDKPVADECVDSDNGVDQHKKGTVTKGDLVIPDACEGSDLIEAVCKNGDTLDVRIPCEHGCYEGACRQQAVVQPAPAPQPEPEQQGVSPADTSKDGKVDDMELLVYIDLWSKGNIDDMALLMAIDMWSKQ